VANACVNVPELWIDGRFAPSGKPNTIRSAYSGLYGCSLKRGVELGVQLCLAAGLENLRVTLENVRKITGENCGSA
jgi:hypothetical protein